MRAIDRQDVYRLRHRKRPSTNRERRSASEASAGRVAPRLEPLESRSLLSTLPLNGFPAGGFRAETLAGTPPWDVAVVVDNQPVTAQGYAESTERIAAAPQVAVSPGQETWIAGIIGDTKLRGSDAATNEVDFYRIDLPQGYRYALSLQVLAQKFGSGLDAAVSVLDSGGQVLASNDEALHKGFLSDAELYAGLDGGTYYIAVSAGGNLPGEDGFDPLTPGSGDSSRGSTGQYLMKLSAKLDSVGPQVVETSIEPGETLHSTPIQITVRFNEAMNLQGLQQGATLTDSSGTSIKLSAFDYDSLTHQVSYMLMDRPVAGDYEFTLHAAQVTDRANNAIDAGGPNGDYTLEFRIETPEVVSVDTELNETAGTAQPLGPLFAGELRNGVQVDGVASVSVPGGDHDFYRFQVTQTGFFTFRLRPGADTQQSGVLRLHDAAGNQLAQAFRLPGMSSTLIRWLRPGEYLVEMDASSGVPSGSYQLSIQAANIPEIPLSDNDPVPAVQVVLRTLDGEKPPESKTSESTSSTESTASTTSMVSQQMSYAVNSLQPVASQPVGAPQNQTAGSELAWADNSGSGQPLPAGFVLGQPSRTPAARFSVDGVSGSFHDALPNAVPHGIHPLDPSTQLASELAALVRGGFGEGAASSGADAARDAAIEDGSGAHFSDVGSDELGEDAFQVVMSPSSLALGMVASIGVASVMNGSPRRRSSNWVDRAVEWLGMK